jgi:hypothetical protein
MVPAPAELEFGIGSTFRIDEVDQLDWSGIEDDQLNNNVPPPTPTSDTTVIQLFKIVSLLSAVAQEVGMSNDEITAALENRDE